jgi:membrane-bound lytic murein transglycosylase A
VAAALAVLLAASCSVPRGWVPVTGGAAIPFSDDGTRDSLLAALAQSRAYYGNLPAAYAIQYGEQSYTPQQMVRSLDLFESLVRNVGDPDSFQKELRRRFLVFESVAESGNNLFTGYYEPVIPGSDAPRGTLTTPLYSRPADLLEIPLELFGKDLPARRLMGRVNSGRVVPYYSRREIEQQGTKNASAKAIVYVDPVDLFFLQIQGSGRVEMPDGRVLRVGYDASNGHPYRSLGAEMIRREMLRREDVTLQSIRQYLAQNPERVAPLLNSNPSYVFFRERQGEEGPVGSLGVPLVSGRSLAADQRLLPPAGIVYVMTTVPVVGDPAETQPLRRFMLVQDIGGAIRGHGRGDIFWGAGAAAEWRAGYARSPGRLFAIVARKEFVAGPEGAP